ncbi:MAG: RNA ligase, Rnl2 family [Candidatus Symbiothrix sp.]|jgi:Rnl2 family RNA ligase|nr:RNA ligase, Rnl2 family [Candidatus Symbiothrix sp.]
MLEFKKYNSVENTFDKEFMNRIMSEGYDSQQYVVQEKVHGSNCCFTTDGQDLGFGKRTSLVEDGEKFYDYKELLERYRDKVIRLFQRVRERYDGTRNMLVYGEMFGGKYPHPDVKNDSKVMNIQKGVFYSPIHEFYGFDIFIYRQEKGRYLSVDEVNELFEAEQFLYAKTLFRGDLKECLQYPNAFQSHIAEWLGLPPVEDNICEGIVIRPVEPLYFGNGARILLKSKNSRFAEKKSVKKRQPALFVEPTYSDELNKQLLVTEEYVTENRLNNVISKIGQISLPKEMGKLIGLFSKDIQEDYLKEHASNYALLEKSEQKILNKHVNKQAADLIKLHAGFYA